jgi:hypothetical protein
MLFKNAWIFCPAVSKFWEAVLHVPDQLTNRHRSRTKKYRLCERHPLAASRQLAPQFGRGLRMNQHAKALSKQVLLQANTV